MSMPRDHRRWLLATVLLVSIASGIGSVAWLLLRSEPGRASVVLDSGIDLERGDRPPRGGPADQLAPLVPRRASGQAAVTVHGRVHDEDGRAITGAFVRVTASHDDGVPGDDDDPPVTVVTTANGAFAASVHGVTFLVIAEAEGFAPGFAAPVCAGAPADIVLVPGASYWGHTIDVTSAAIPGAEITVTFALGTALLERRTTSGADGRWQVDHLPAVSEGAVSIEGRASGFARAVVNSPPTLDPPATQEVAIVFLRPLVIGGRVTELDGSTPLAGATVELTQPSSDLRPRPGRNALVLERVTADEQGRFEFHAVPPATTLVDDLVGIARGVGHAPGIEPIPSSSRVGGRSPHPLQIRCGAVATVVGRVVDSAQSPLGGVTVRAADGALPLAFLSTDDLLPAGISGEDGRWSIEVACGPAPVRLTLRRETAQCGWGTCGPFAVSPGAVLDAGDVVLDLAPAVIITVVDPDEHPIPGAACQPADDDSPRGARSADARGRAVVSWIGHEPGAAAAVSVRAAGFVERTVDVIPVLELREVTVALARAAELHLVVAYEDGSPGIGLPVAVSTVLRPVEEVFPRSRDAEVGDDLRDEVVVEGKTDRRGECWLKGLPAGPWHLAVWNAAGDEDPVLRLSAVAATGRDFLVTVPGSAPESRPAEEAVTLEVQVTDAVTGAPVVGAVVGIDGCTLTEVGAGMFRASKLARTVVQVAVFAAGYIGRRAHDVDLREGGIQRIVEPLDPGVTLRVHARLPAGMAMSRGMIYWSSSAGRDGTGVSLDAQDEAEFRGVPGGKSIEIFLQGQHAGGFITLVPSPFHPLVTPSGHDSVDLAVDFVRASDLQIILKDRRDRSEPRNPWHLSAHAVDDSWSRSWRIDRGDRHACRVPAGKVVVRCQVPGCTPLEQTVECGANGGALPVEFVLR